MTGNPEIPDPLVPSVFPETQDSQAVKAKRETLVWQAMSDLRVPPDLPVRMAPRALQDPREPLASEEPMENQDPKERGDLWAQEGLRDSPDPKALQGLRDKMAPQASKETLVAMAKTEELESPALAEAQDLRENEG